MVLSAHSYSGRELWKISFIFCPSITTKSQGWGGSFMIETILDTVVQRHPLYHISYQVFSVSASPRRHPGCIRVSLSCIWDGVFLWHLFPLNIFNKNESSLLGGWSLGFETSIILSLTLVLVGKEMRLLLCLEEMNKRVRLLSLSQDGMAHLKKWVRNILLSNEHKNPLLSSQLNKQEYWHILSALSQIRAGEDSAGGSCPVSGALIKWGCETAGESEERIGDDQRSRKHGSWGKAEGICIAWFRKEAIEGWPRNDF